MGLTIGRVHNRRDIAILGTLCCLAYAASYLGRINYSAAMTEILESGVLDRTQCGTLATVYFAIYGIGQIINGVLADRHSPVGMVLVGTLGAGVCNLLMGLDMAYPLRILLWGGNGFFQAMLWGPMLIVVSRCILPDRRGGILLGLNAAPSLGTIAAYLLSGGLLWLFSWRSVFTGAGLALLAVGVLWGVVCVRLFRRPQTEEEPQELPVEETAKPAAAGNGSSLYLLVISGAILLAAASMVHGMLKDGITTWIPTYLMEEYGVPAQIAVVLTVLTPMVNVLGAFVGCQVARVSRSEAHGAALFFGVAAAALVLLIVVPRWPIVLCALLLSLITAAMYGANVILVSQMPLRFELQGKAATISGIINAAAYVGCAISTYAIADLSDRLGWTLTKVTWLAACLLALVCCLLAIRRWMRFRGQIEG